jgi:hypothetical protein
VKITARYFSLEQRKDEVFMVARVLLMILFVYFGWQKLTGFSGTVAYMTSTGAPAPTLSAIIAVVMEFAVGIARRPGAFLLPWLREQSVPASGPCVCAALCSPVGCEMLCCRADGSGDCPAQNGKADTLRLDESRNACILAARRQPGPLVQGLRRRICSRFCTRMAT